MHVSSKHGTATLFAAALAIMLWGLGVPALAKNHDYQQSSCAPKVTPTCHVAPPACPAPPPPPQVTCCQVDTHAQHEAAEQAARDQKAAEHAAHEAAEECARNQKKAEHAQHEAEEAQARANDKLAKANELAAAMCCRPESHQ